MLQKSDGAVSVGSYPDARHAWFVVVCLQVAFAVALVDRQILSLLVQPIKSDLQLTDTEFSLVAGVAFVVFYSTFGLVLGRAADRLNRRNMIIMGMLLWSAATIACGLARNFHELFLARTMVGVGEAALSPAAYSMIADLFAKERRARPLSIYTMGLFTGSGIALLFGAGVVAYASRSTAITLPLLGDVRDWQLVFMVVGLPGLIMSAVMLAVKEPQRQELAAPSAGGGDLRRFVSSHGKVLSLIIAAFAFNGVVYYGIGVWTPAVFIRRFGWVASEIGVALGVLQLTAGTGGILLSSWWVARAKSATAHLSISRYALLAMPPTVLVFGFSGNSTVAIIALTLLVFVGALVSAQQTVALYHVTPSEYRGQIVAVFAATGTLFGLGVGSTLIAATTDYVFQDETAVGKSCAFGFTLVALLGAECLRRVIKLERSGCLNMDGGAPRA